MIPLLFSWMLLSASNLFIPSADSMALPGCQGSCGNLSIPFPFGITSDCYLDDSFLVICNSSFNPPKPFLQFGGKAEILNISLNGKLRILNSSMSMDLMDDQLENTKKRGNESSVLAEVVIEWAAGDVACHVARDDVSRYACQALHSRCTDSSSGRGYICHCLPGFQGNPYLIDGCRDINECEVLDPCSHECINLAGSFKCSCPDGFIGDGRKDGTGCHPNHHQIDTHQKNDKHPVDDWSYSSFIYSPLVAIFLLSPVITSAWIFWIHRKNKLANQRKKFFQQNGGDLLKEKLNSKSRKRTTSLRIYTAEDMKKATTNFHPSKILRRDEQSTFYRGISPEDSNLEVVVKMIPRLSQPQIEKFVEQLEFFSQTHPNLVRIMGCCLETDSPFLVYELNPNDMDKNLFEYIHARLPLHSTVETRLKAAVGIAEALACSHSKSGPKIIHGRFKSRNILLDSSSGEAKLFDTVACRDPELTEKNDVYSFGFFLVELLLGDNVYDLEGLHFQASWVTEGRWLPEILDDHLTGNRNSQLVKEIAMLAERCLRVKSEDRPTMKKVRAKLIGLAGLR